jgi:FO synthase subunit 1
MTLTAAAGSIEPLQTQGICEILILSGEVHPRSARRAAWFQRIYDLCELSFSLGFLPHTNAGPLSYAEMAQLKQVNVSMGLMLEQLTPKLLSTVHRQAPSKIPQVRLEQLEWAGKLRIPFTTGLLLGIGEDEPDWQETLAAIADLHRQYSHIQEVILQPYSFGTTQIWDAPTCHPQRLPEVVAIARQILPTDITIQIPPNLVEDAGWLLACLEAGARDLGGIGPKDEVNPDYPHSPVQRLQEILEPTGWQLVPRLPIYPQYDSWLSERSQIAVRQWRTKIESGFENHESVSSAPTDCKKPEASN